jgi:hypothetical protein
MGNCPICNSPCEQHLQRAEAVDCPRCGRFIVERGSRLSGFVLKDLSDFLGDPAFSTHRRSRLSYQIQRRQSPGARHIVDIDQMERWRLDDPLPSPAEQLDGLILWVGDERKSPSETVRFSRPTLAAWLGVMITPDQPEGGLDWLLVQSEVERLFETDLSWDPPGLRLLMPGWERYHALKRGRVESRKAFMAMKFGVPELDRVYNECFKLAVARWF